MIETITIRNATIDDKDKLFDLYRSVSSRENSSEEGFLVEQFSNEDFKRMLCSEDTNWLIAENEEELLGFVMYSSTLNKYASATPGQRGDFNWNVDQEDLFSGDLIYVEKLGVSPGHRHRRVATKLYEELEKKGLPMFAFIVTAPIFNLASVSFHLSQGFKVVGEHNGKYRSLLFCKQ